MDDIDTLSAEDLRSLVRSLQNELNEHKAGLVSSAYKRQLYIYMYGGLGNQLFQAAFALALGEALKADVALIACSYKDDELRSFLLNSFPAVRLKVVPIEDAIGATVIHERDCRRCRCHYWYPNCLLYWIKADGCFFPASGRMKNGLWNGVI